MNTKTLEKFAQNARRQLLEQVGARRDRVLQTDSAELRDQAQAVQQLKDEMHKSSRGAVIDRVAYTWFNRFSALRYMDANHYTRTGIVSPSPGFTQPQILQEAKQGHIDPELVPYVEAQRVFDLLAGRIPSRDGQQEAYRQLLVAACNAYNKVMPFLFEQIADYTELLMPEDLLSPNSVLNSMREALTTEACQDVEVIGWLYQFYISEKKDEVIGSKQKIQAEDIPAATQLFTPHWIVRYLVENSLGRLWLLNKPRSRLAECMDYYIPPAPPVIPRSSPPVIPRSSPPVIPRSSPPVIPRSSEESFLRVNSPEELTVCDPAVGSGHMLTYAFDLLYAIYEEEGYNPPDIPRLILEKNLTGLEIDDRAGALAAFALTMKARAKDRRFLERSVTPRVTVLQPMIIDRQELEKADWFRDLGRNLLDLPLQDALLHDLGLLQQVNNIGSLLRPQMTSQQVVTLRERISRGTDLFSHALNTQVLGTLGQLEPLARGYHVVVANPPYMGGRNMNDDLKKFATVDYPASKSDLFAMFMERNLDFAQTRGYVAMITMQSWMFLSSYEKLRTRLLEQQTVRRMAHLGARAFDTIGGEVVSTTAFVLERYSRPESEGNYVRLVDGRSEAEKEADLSKAIRDPECDWFYHATAIDFQKIPGSPIAYWLSKYFLKVFEQDPLSKRVVSAGRCKTHNDTKFVRFFWEVPQKRIGPSNYWKFLGHGGAFKKWYGNRSRVFDWSEQAKRTYSKFGGLSREKYWNKAGITWSDITSSINGFRYKPGDSENSTLGPTILPNRIDELPAILGFLNSKIARDLLAIINPTFHANVGDVLRLPYIHSEESIALVENIVAMSEINWNSYEDSYSFSELPMLDRDFHQETVAGSYELLRGYWNKITHDIQILEEKNNQIFIEAFDLDEALTAFIPLDEITLTCNPYFRYGTNNNGTQLETRLLADTMREFISYAVGCMVGRYSLDKPGLILADQGETVEDYYHIVGMPPDAVQFTPDRDNVIPILDGDWFPDDIVGRFKRFLRVTFGEEHYEENLAFIESALGKDIRSYFLREFYDRHVRMYKKRPIYWLFSSPKGSFNALIYMHRYRPDTVSVILNDYLRDFHAKLEAERSQQATISVSAAASAREKTRADNEIAKLDKMLKELRDYENEILYPLAAQQIDIDLDDGVLVNYNKFGKALKRVSGLSN